MSRAPLHHSQFEPAVMRLQLEMGLARREAEACVRGGYNSAADIAAADDGEFGEAVRLSPERRGEVLARAREPGSRREVAPAPPRLARDRRPGGAIVKVTKPVRETVAKLAGEAEAAPAASRGPKPAPPHEQDARRRSKRESASEAEAELDERLKRES